MRSFVEDAQHTVGVQSGVPSQDLEWNHGHGAAETRVQLALWGADEGCELPRGQSWVTENYSNNCY